MCKAFSGIVEPGGKVHWKFGVDSHSELVRTFGLRDNTYDPAEMAFAKFEITPKNNDYLFPDEWVYRVDESPVPRWCGEKHREAALAAHKKWLAKLDKILIRKKIVHPFSLTPPEIGKKQVALLRRWASVGYSVRASVWASVGASVGASVWDSVRASVWAYAGSFLNLPEWKYVKHPRGKYPFGPAVKLWEMGLVPSFDGKTWRLHGEPKAKVLFEISAENLRASE